MPDWLNVIVILLALVGLGFLAWLATHIAGRARNASKRLESLELKVQTMVEANVRDTERRWVRRDAERELAARVEKLETELQEHGKLGAELVQVIGKLTIDVRQLQRLNRMVEGWAEPSPVAPEATPPSPPPPPAQAPTTTDPGPRPFGPQDLPEAVGEALIPTRRIKG